MVIAMIPGSRGENAMKKPWKGGAVQTDLGKDSFKIRKT